MKVRGPFGSFSPGIGPPKHDIFYVNFGPFPKNCGPNSMSFQFLTGGHVDTGFTFAPLTSKLWQRLCPKYITT